MNTGVPSGRRSACRALRWLPGALGWTLCTIGSGVAEESPRFAPLLARDHHPFIALYGIPPPERVEPLSTGRAELRLTLDVANHSIEERAADEAILLDGETYRTTLSVRFGLGDRWEVGLDLPYVHARQAVFDEEVDDWHDLLGITTPNRDDFDMERLSFRYVNDAETLELSEATDGPGDIRIILAKAWGDGALRRAALRVGMQLPTGDAGRLSGIGTAGVSLDIATTRHFSLFGRSAGAYGRVGLAAIGDGGLLEGRRRPRVGYANLGLGWQIASPLTLKLQLDAHQGVFRSALGPLGRSAFQISTGGAWRLSRATVLEIALQENIRRDPVPDVAVQIGLGHRF